MGTLAEWGEHCYAIAQTTALTKDGKLDRSTQGMYATLGGYASVLIWKDACPIYHNYFMFRASASARTGWETVKPLVPALKWVRRYTESEDPIVVPYVGTVPAAIAAERLG